MNMLLVPRKTQTVGTNKWTKVMHLVPGEHVLPPLVIHNNGTIFSASYAGGLVTKFLDEKPLFFQLSDPIAELLTVMQLTSSISEPLLDIYPSPLGHVPIFAVTQLNLDAVDLTELLCILWRPVGP
jgi:hypothetical protein